MRCSSEQWRPRMQGRQISLPTCHARCCSTPKRWGRPCGRFASRASSSSRTHSRLAQPHATGPDIGTSALLFAAADQPGRLRSLVVGGGGAAVPLQLGVELKQIVDAPNLAAMGNVEPRPGECSARLPLPGGAARILAEVGGLPVGWYRVRRGVAVIVSPGDATTGQRVSVCGSSGPSPSAARSGQTPACTHRRSPLDPRGRPASDDWAIHVTRRDQAWTAIGHTGRIVGVCCDGPVSVGPLG
jgi:hypothetical protein